MAGKIITTNLRIPDYNWLELKTLAAGGGVSVNEFLNILINEYALKHVMAPDIKIKKSKKSKNIWAALRDLAQTPSTNEPLGKLSEEDMVIYET